MEEVGVGPFSAGRPRGRRALGGAVVAIVLLGSLLPASPGLAAAGRVPGIDVSKWQGEIDWEAVSGTRVRFVIMRATIGNQPTIPASVDPRFEEYMAGATASGLVVGAYHRANVGRADGDARREADLFVDTARNAAGDVLPVLDIEETHGLTPAEMREWVRTWVKRVLARTGVRPMLYASPNFWRVHMGDTTWFADRGYPLWIAHWGVTAPDVPASDWGGHGWSYWQWTSTGSVDGIATDVDRDRFDGENLSRGRIASLDVTPAAGGRIDGPRIACGGSDDRCERLANPDAILTLTATPDPGAALLGWTGACVSAGQAPTCDVIARGAKRVSARFGYPVTVERDGSGDGLVTSEPAGMDCGATCAALFPAGSTVTLGAAPDSASAFTGWGGACAGPDPVCALTVSGPLSATASFASVVSVEQDGDGARLTWGLAEDPRAIGGSYRWERRASASAEHPFSGGAVTLFTVSGPAMGRARVSIDGSVVETFDGYEPAIETQVRHRFEGIGPGEHVLTVTVLGTGRPASRGTRVAVDGLRWGGALHRTPRSSARWATVTDAAASGGDYAVGDAPGATARLRFVGTGVSLGTRRGPAMGHAEVWLDGELLRTIDLYAPSPVFATVPLASGLTDERHVVALVVAGTRRPASSGRAVAVDRWVVS